MKRSEKLLSRRQHVQTNNGSVNEGASVEPCGTSTIYKKNSSENLFPSLNNSSNRGLFSCRSEKMPILATSNLDREPQLSSLQKPERPKSRRLPRNSMQQHAEDVPLFESEKKKLIKQLSYLRSYTRHHLAQISLLRGRKSI